MSATGSGTTPSVYGWRKRDISQVDAIFTLVQETHEPLMSPSTPSEPNRPNPVVLAVHSTDGYFDAAVYVQPEFYKPRKQARFGFKTDAIDFVLEVANRLSETKSLADIWNKQVAERSIRRFNQVYRDAVHARAKREWEEQQETRERAARRNWVEVERPKTHAHARSVWESKKELARGRRARDYLGELENETGQTVIPPEVTDEIEEIKQTYVNEDKTMYWFESRLEEAFNAQFDDDGFPPIWEYKPIA